MSTPTVCRTASSITASSHWGCCFSRRCSCSKKASAIGLAHFLVNGVGNKLRDSSSIANMVFRSGCRGQHRVRAIGNTGALDEASGPGPIKLACPASPRVCCETTVVRGWTGVRELLPTPDLTTDTSETRLDNVEDRCRVVASYKTMVSASVPGVRVLHCGCSGRLRRQTPSIV
jgi:hypothetical protein